MTAMKVSPIERVMLAGFRLADANRAYRAAVKARAAIACSRDDGKANTACWKGYRKLPADLTATFCPVCTEGLPVIRAAATAWKARRRAKAYFWRAIGKVKGS